MIKRILIANRGEIARRIIRSAKQRGIETVSLYTDEEKDAPWVHEADAAVSLGSGKLQDTYLNVDAILHKALSYACDAIHPGYGFLAEHAEFAERTQAAGLIFIGPDPEVIRLMGDKTRARAFVEQIGIPVPKGLRGTRDELLKSAAELHFPIMIKAAAGGGGRGMHIVHHPEELKEKLEQAQREAQAWFGKGDLFVEQFFEEARHIEVQILADTQGNAVHLYERECSIQRNYQKIIEEAPSPTLTEEQRSTLTSAALHIAREAKYSNAGTIEFLWHQGEFFFLEMNTRIQVEHPVSEAITGIDLIAQQIDIAASGQLHLQQEDITRKGHAIEARICAENPDENFKPSAGTIHYFKAPIQPIRMDAALEGPTQVSTQYDNMLAKLITWAPNRETARKQLVEALENTVIHGVEQNTAYLHRILNTEVFLQNKIHTRLLQQKPELFQADTAQTEQLPLFIAGILLKQQLDAADTPFSAPLHGVREMSFYFMEQNYNFLILEEKAGIQITQNKKTLSFVSIGYSPKGLEIEHEDKKYTLQLSRGEKSWWVQHQGQIYQLCSQHQLSQIRLKKKESTQTSGGKQSISSPLHGTVSKINIALNERVKQGQSLLSIESMKTDNQILSPVDGLVSKVFIQQDEQVKESQLLIEINN